MNFGALPKLLLVSKVSNLRKGGFDTSKHDEPFCRKSSKTCFGMTKPFQRMKAMYMKLPEDPTSRRNARIHFKQEMSALTNNFEGEEKKGNRYTDFTPTLLRLIYDYGQEIDREGLTKKFIENTKLKQHNCDSKVVESNIFAVIIEAYIRKHLSPQQLGSAQRSKFSRALAYAYDHKVTTDWLGAFLKEAGGYEAAAKKYDQGELEGWLMHPATFE